MSRIVQKDPVEVFKQRTFEQIYEYSKLTLQDAFMKSGVTYVLRIDTKYLETVTNTRRSSFGTFWTCQSQGI